ncbi:hypothetical protein J6590_037303 [Homalodisca vitripennis]|nr:hypothetical protein J6590_037303 [Homalodisca vitripennis]
MEESVIELKAFYQATWRVRTAPVMMSTIIINERKGHVLIIKLSCLCDKCRDKNNWKAKQCVRLQGQSVSVSSLGRDLPAVSSSVGTGPTGDFIVRAETCRRHSLSGNGEGNEKLFELTSVYKTSIHQLAASLWTCQVTSSSRPSQCRTHTYSVSQCVRLADESSVEYNEDQSCGSYMGQIVFPYSASVELIVETIIAPRYCGNATMVRQKDPDTI